MEVRKRPRDEDEADAGGGPGGAGGEARRVEKHVSAVAQEEEEEEEARAAQPQGPEDSEKGASCCRSLERDGGRRVRRRARPRRLPRASWTGHGRRRAHLRSPRRGPPTVAATGPAAR